MQHPLFYIFTFTLCFILKIVKASGLNADQTRGQNFRVFSTFHSIATTTAVRYESHAVKKKTFFASISEGYKALNAEVQIFTEDIVDNPIVRHAIDNEATFLPLVVTSKSLGFVAWIPYSWGAFYISLHIATFVALLETINEAPSPLFDFSITAKQSEVGLSDWTICTCALSFINLIASISKNANDFYRYFLPLRQHASIIRINIPQDYTRFAKPLDIIPVPSYPLAFRESPDGIYDAILIPRDALPFISCPIVLSADKDSIAVLFIKSRKFVEGIKYSKVPVFAIDMRLLKHF